MRSNLGYSELKRLWEVDMVVGEEQNDELKY